MLAVVQVLLSSYNGEKYIKEQINSILAQKRVEVYLLIRDDGSQDRTLTILSEYEKNDHVKVIQGDNCGSTESFLKLINQAGNFDYYAFADQDDVWDDDKLFVAIEKIKDITVPALYSSNTRIVDMNLNYITIVDRKPVTKLGSAIVKNYVAGCTMVFNKLLIQEAKQFVSPKVPYHDWWLNLICLSLGGISIYDPEPHMSYRQHGSNVVGSNDVFIKKWISRFNRFFNTRYRRDLMAGQILETCSSKVPKYEKDLLELISASVKHPWKIISSNKFRTENAVDDFFFYICVICKKA